MKGKNMKASDKELHKMYEGSIKKWQEAKLAMAVFKDKFIGRPCAFCSATRDEDGETLCDRCVIPRHICTDGCGKDTRYDRVAKSVMRAYDEIADFIDYLEMCQSQDLQESHGWEDE
jgi:hypothetical protein